MNIAQQCLVSKLIKSKEKMDTIHDTIDDLEIKLKSTVSEMKELQKDIDSLEIAICQIDPSIIKITLSDAIKDPQVSIRLVSYQEARQLEQELHSRNVKRMDGSSYSDKTVFIYPINQILFFPSTGAYANICATVQDAPLLDVTGCPNMVNPTKIYYLHEIDIDDFNEIDDRYLAKHEK